MTSINNKTEAQQRRGAFGTYLVASLGIMLSACTHQHVESSSAAAADDVQPTQAAVGECHGVNSCKGQGACGSKGSSCAGVNACKGQGWLPMTEAECKTKKGRFQAVGTAHAPH